MSERSINNMYTVLVLVYFGVFWYKLGTWWWGVIGMITFPLVTGLLHGLVSGILYRLRGYPLYKYPAMFYIATITLIIFYLKF